MVLLGGVFLFVSATSSSASAGRPVYSELGLEELTARASVVLIGEWADAPTPPKNGCEPYTPRIRVVEVLRSARKSERPAPEVGQDLLVVLNTVAQRDCALRKANPGSGASFAAERIASSLERAPQVKGARFLAFLDGGGGLVADGALLSLTHERSVRSQFEAPRPATSPLPAGKLYPVPADWKKGTVAAFCEAQLKGSTVTGGLQCRTGEAVLLVPDHGRHPLQPCAQAPSPSAVMWRALHCAILVP